MRLSWVFGQRLYPEGWDHLQPIPFGRRLFKPFLTWRGRITPDVHCPRPRPSYVPNEKTQALTTTSLSAPGQRLEKESLPYGHAGVSLPTRGLEPSHLDLSTQASVKGGCSPPNGLSLLAFFGLGRCAISKPLLRTEGLGIGTFLVGE